MHQVIKGFLSADDIRLMVSIADARSHWQDGRQETGYEKLNIKDEIDCQPAIVRALGLVGAMDEFWDAYLLRYPNGAYIPTHKDDAGFGREKHMRLNALIEKPEDGGKLTINYRSVDLDVGDAVIFMPNAQVHSVSKVFGERLMFSVGCWI